MEIFAVVLAAGQSSRFGSSKLLQSWHGQSLVSRAVTQAASVCGQRTLLLVGHDGAAVSAAASPFPGFIAVNDRYADGMGTSIAAAIRLLQCSATAVIVTLADQPLVEARHLEKLIQAWSGDPGEIVASEYAGTLGPPALFARDSFSALAELEGDRGAREILQSDRFQIQSVPCAAAAFDIDEPGDLEQRSQFTQPESPST